MKVLKDNYNPIEEVKETKHYPREFSCEYCESELEYDKSDLKIGEYGCAYIICPLCKKKLFIDDEDLLILTVDNFEFPTHFSHTCIEEGAVDCCDNKHVKEYVHKAIEYFRKNKEEYHWFTATGNLRVDVTRWSGDETYEVVVTNNYYSTEIPFEEEDY